MTEWQQIFRHWGPEGEGPALTFGVDPQDRTKFAFWEEGRDPAPLTQPVNVLWIDGGPHRPRVVFCGALDPDAARVLLDTPPPGGFRDYPAHVVPEHLWPYRPIWLFGAIPFRPGEVIVRWQTEDRKRWRTVPRGACVTGEWGYTAGKSWDTVA